ncbi:hypothetical protein V6N11_077127 [Hibiscus sabdariffa]|uniref:BED-type domain-containing protein n=1 Tax=Hibiscus sabdariffa TaxID=183260 RepID=A0ABR2TCK9_9ROSI
MSVTGENVNLTLSSSTESPKEPEKIEETPTSGTKKRKGKKPVEAEGACGKRKKTSTAWDHFKKIDGEKERAECIYCAAKISCSTANGTNAMKRHTNRCKKAPFNLDKKQTILDFESKTKCNADGTIETKAFRNMKTKYLPYTKELRKVGGAPDDEDWDKVASFLPFLEMFYETTLSFSGSRYVTGNTFVEQIYDIGYTINHYVDDLQLNDGLRSMARQMKLKFDKYWANVNNLNVLMFISLVLDPRHKLRYVEWIVRRSYDPTNSSVLCLRIKDVLTRLFDFYASMHPSSTQKTSCSGNPNSSEMKDLISEQPTIVIDETNEVSDTTHELS